MSSAKKNFIYNIVYQLLILIIPLIIAPYLARVVKADGVGVYSYTYSIVYYFMLFTLLGVNNYGNRSIAKIRDDNEKLSKTFFEIYALQLILGIAMFIFYMIYVFFICNKYVNIAFLQSMFIISSILDINWFFFGIEDFKKTITRNTMIKIGTVLLIFIFVKNANDLWKYTLVMSGTTCLGQLVLWSFLRKKIHFIKIKISDVVKHIKPNLVLFVPVIAVSLYKMMDKIMLGSLTNVTEVGYYENAEKIINIPMTLITALGTVMLPRISNIFAKGDFEKINKYIEKSIKFVMFMSFAMCCGLICVGYNFAQFYFGKEFQKTGLLIMLLSITLPFLSFANVIRTQYLIPNEKDKIYIISVSLGAVTNLIMNMMFIPKYMSIGACIGTISAEIMVMICQTCSVSKELPVRKYIKSIIPFIIKALIMLVIIYPIGYIKASELIILPLQVMIGGIIYVLLNAKYITTIVDINKILKKYIFRKKEIK